MSYSQPPWISDEIYNTYYAAAAEAKEILKTAKYFRNPIVIFDIDETLIFSKGGTIGPMRDLYNYIKMMGIPIAIVSARHIKHIKGTHDQLQLHGIVDYTHLELLNWYVPINIDRMKADVRERLEKKYTILINIGDRDSDHRFGHYVHAIKLHDFK